MAVKPRSLFITIFIVFLLPVTIAQVDNRKGTWLPGSNDSLIRDSLSIPVNVFLKSLTGNMRPLLCIYDSVVLKSKKVFLNGKASTKTSSWTCSISVKKVPGSNDALDLNLKYIVTSGSIASSGVAIAFDFQNWKAENYVLVPGAVYNANRFRVRPEKYPPYIYDEKDKPSDMPITITDVPRLNEDQSPAKIELLSRNCATPLMSFYNPEKKRGFILLSSQETKLGSSAMMIEEDLSKSLASFVLSAPGVREKRYIMTGFDRSGDEGANWKTGDSLEIKFRLYNFNSATLQDFIDKVSTVRKDLSGPTKYRNIEPFSSITETILDHHDKTKWLETDKYGYICNDPFGNGKWSHMMQAGWSGVPLFCYSYIIEPTDERLRRVVRTFDSMENFLPAATGLSYAKFNGQLLGDNSRYLSTKTNLVLIRRSGEMLYFGIHCFNALKMNGHGNTIKPSWELMYKKMADGLVKLWNNNKQFGQFVDVETGEIDVPGSSAGVVCASALALASEYFKNPGYLKVAKEAAQFYYDRDLSKGYAGGAPREILQAPDSESAFNMVDAYIILYEMTGDKNWLQYSREAASLLSTWGVSYKYRFPPESLLGKAGVDATGSIMASVQNTHSAPCLFIHSGDFLLKLYRATGDKRYAELLKDIAHNVVQYVTTETNPVIPHAFPGSMSERVQISDWEGKENIGSNIPDGFSEINWETGALFSIMQNPGIYICTDKSDLVVFDHVDAEIVKKDEKGLTLKISNKTHKDAHISVFAETAEQSKKPMGNYAFLKWPGIEVKAGKTEVYKVDISGEITQKR